MRTPLRKNRSPLTPLYKPFPRTRMTPLVVTNSSSEEVDALLVSFKDARVNVAGEVEGTVGFSTISQDVRGRASNTLQQTNLSISEQVNALKES